jgi:ABC-2 type transport system ATP-binding protein
MKEAITVKNLTKKFKTRKGKFVAVDNLSFSVPKGSITGFIGPNGAGKSTTIKMILDLIRPTEGEIKLFGSSSNNKTVKKHLGYMPERDAFHEEMFPLDYLIYLAGLTGIHPEHAHKMAEELLENLGLLEAQNKRIGGFSSGMKKKISFAQSIIHHPKLLIMDEPTANLDPLAQEQMLTVLLRLKEMGSTILISSHNIEELEKMIDYLVVINKGKLIVESDLKSIQKKASSGLLIEVEQSQQAEKLLLKLGHPVSILKSNQLLLKGNFDAVEKNKIMKLLLNNGINITSISTKSEKLWDIILHLLKEK